MKKMKSENKKAISIGITAILAISVFVALSMSGTVNANPGTNYYVNAATGNDADTGLTPGAAWKTITHAANTVPAGASLADPNVIYVAAGLYDATNNGEAFAITFNNANIHLIGSGAATTTIDGEGAGTILEIKATGITVAYFNITNAADGIGADVGGFVVRDNVFFDLDDGVNLTIVENDLATDYAVDEIWINDNRFNISENGVYVDIELDYDAALTGYTATIGGIYIRDNIFNMTATIGINIDDIWVQELNGGSISVDDVSILRNEFYGGDTGIKFFGDFYDITNTDVIVWDVIINENTFEDQTDDAMHIDYYDADYWYGTTTGIFGDLVINDNEITSAEPSCDGIAVSDYAYFEYFEGDASLTVGDLYIEGNEIDVDGEGIGVYYEYAYELYDNTLVTMGEAFITGNTIGCDFGIYLEYYDFGEEMYGNSMVTTGDVHIEDNTIDAGDDAIYVYYEYVAYEMYSGTTLLMGDTYIEDNQVTSDSDGIYLEYEDYEVGYEMYDNAYAELPDYVITGNTFNVTGDGIYLYTYENPYYIYDNATFDFGGAFIDDNTFSCEYGIYFDYDDFCYDNYDNSATIIGDVTITNNRFNDLDYEAIYIYYDNIGYCLYDYSTLDVGDLVIADNVIDGVDDGDGIDVEYWYIYSEYDATVTMGTLDITGNTISDVDEDGIDVDYYLDAEDDSTVSVGRALIQGNTIDDCGEAGIDIYMDIDSDPGAVVNLGNPVIDGNTISNCEDGIYLEDVGQGQALGIEGKGYHRAKESINTIPDNDNEGKAVKEHGSAKNKKVSSESRSAEERSKPEREEIQRHNAKEGVEGVNILGISNNGGQVCPATISNNEITDNENGIWLDNSGYNKILRNKIARNSVMDTGVHLTDGSNYNEIRTNCFYNNTPQAYDDGYGNDWNGNYWSPPPGGEPGNYSIPPTFTSKDNDPLPNCPLGKPPVKVPELTPIGIIALVGILSVMLAFATLRRKRE